jgi:hypothetical protein
MNIDKTKIAVASGLIDDKTDEFTNKELIKRLNYLIKINKELYEMEEDHAELQYGIGDTINILQVLKSAVKR